MEKIITIEGYPLYQISNKGIVYTANEKGNWNPLKSLKTIVHNRSGYCVVNLYSYDSGKSKMKQFRIHKLVAMHFLDNPDNKSLVNHKNGNKQDNRVENLEWCSHSENMVHAYKTGLCLQPKGIKTTKLNKDLVCKIRNEKKENLTSNYTLSKKYNVSEATIANLINKKSWTWV